MGLAFQQAAQTACSCPSTTCPALLPLKIKGNTNNSFTKYWVMNVLYHVACDSMIES